MPAEVLPRGQRGWRLALVALGLVALVAWVFHPVRDHEFLSYDDRSFIEENAALSAGLSREGLRYAFSSTTDGNWLPLTWISFLVDQELHGLSAGATQLTNVVLHAASTLLLWLALLRLLAFAALPPLVAAFAAAVFAVHPLHVESVAWAIARKDVLSGLCFHLLLLAYAAHAARPGGWRYACVLCALLLGLLSKPMLVTAPFVLLLLDYWPLGRLAGSACRRRALLEKLPMLLVALVVAGVTLASQSAMHGVQARQAIPLTARVLNAFVSYALYLGRAIWPATLSIHHPHPHLHGGVPLAPALLSLLLLLALSAIAVWQRRARPHLLFGWLWFLGMLVPVIGIVQVGTQAMADRYAYLPLTGPVLAIAVEVARRLRRRPALQRAAALCAALAVLALGERARHHVLVFRDSQSVFENALSVDPDDATAHNGVGFALIELGRLDEAISQLRRAVELDPDHDEAHVNLGVALLEAGEPGPAIPHLEHGLALPPGRRGVVHANLGVALLKVGEYARASEELEQALHEAPDSAQLEQGLGLAYLRLGRPSQARRRLEHAEAIGPDSPELQLALGEAAQATRRLPEALDRYRRALALQPDFVPALNNLALLHASEHAVSSPELAVQLAERARDASGGTDAEVLDTLATAYWSAGRAADAARSWRAAAALARAAGDAALAHELEQRPGTPP